VDDTGRVDKLETLENIHYHVAKEGEGELEFIIVQHIVQTSAWHEFGDNAHLRGIKAHTHEKNDM
jgi:hypothetical protein